MTKCPCGTGQDLKDCCGPLMAGKAKAETPEQLMRSRYTAFCLVNMAYLKSTTHPETRATMNWRENEKWARGAQFEKLEVVSASESGATGDVKFRATFKQNGEQHVHEEHSVFKKEEDIWYFHSAN